MIKVSRRAMLRGVAVTAASVALTSGSAVAALAAPTETSTTCTMRTLPASANTYRSDVTAIDPSGRFIIGSAIVREDTDTYPILLWDHGQLTSFDPPVPGGSPVDVNRDGIAIGNGPLGPSSQPWQYRNGVGTRLAVLDPADETTVVAINSRGDIAGMGLTPSFERYGLLWPAAQPGTVQVINIPTTGSVITGLTDNGTIVGFINLADAESRAWMRTPAGVLRPLAGPDNSSSESVVAANGRWAVGWASVPGPALGLRWDLRTRQHIVLDPRLGAATDVNASGVVLSADLLQRGSTVLTLPSPDPSHVVAGRSLANNGTVAGFHNNRLAGGVRAVYWIGC